MTYTIGIVGHISRLSMAETLANTVDADYLSIDDGTLGCEGNHRKVWNTLAQQHTDWAVVLEDDAVPCNNFRAQLTQALAVAPTPIVSLYLGRQRPYAYQHRIEATINTTANWLLAPRLLHAVAVAIHTNHIPDMLNSLPPRTSIDRAISTWTDTVAYTNPSLVDHSDNGTVAHPPGTRQPGRVAWRFGTRDRWTRDAVHL
ncbi:glycosyltransferase [Mycobacterium phage Jabbawokkie]|uniref:Glycosyltransferase n=1 Tax=Mycobacterium phage Zapner TaxID=1486474 RepID=A0A059VG79_9CAUD|nr:glucosyltransferase [Mycobacterium phage Jabbawokkie]YP_009964025.1 glucosyltransferase [Mycobacterium phage Zapner]AGT12207.1 glycosyltransferase [Mycobacterium phage Jabbawokkie]AHZ95562.1 glycosyltransferase [Mycobacterium phage Zapner]